MTYYPRAFMSSKNEICRSYKYPNFINFIKTAKDEYPSEDSPNNCYESYEKIIESGRNDLILLVEIALEYWLSRSYSASLKSLPGELNNCSEEAESK